MSNDRCLIYCRVSSEKQAGDDKTSLAVQEEHCRKACVERGYEVIGVYKDVIPRSLLERPQLNEVRAKIAAGEVDVLMASVIDRLGSNDYHVYILMEEAERKGARIEFALEEYDDTAMGQLLRSVRTFMAAVELEKLSFRVQQGVNAKIANGEPMGTIPLGYMKDKNDAIVVNPLTAPTIRRIFELYAGGESLYGIKAILESEGHLTLRGKPTWSTSAIHRILAGPGAPKYMGRWQGGQWGQIHQKGKPPKPYLKPKSEWGPVFEGPAIVTEELFNKANKRRLVAKANSPRRGENPHQFLLRENRIKCGECGGKMHGITSRGDGRFYYQCSTTGCRKVNITNRLIDEPAWEICREVLDNPEILLKQSIMQTEDGSLDLEITQAKAEVKALEDEIERLTDLLPIVPDSAAKKIIIRLESLDTQLQKGQQNLHELEGQVNARIEVQEAVVRFVDWQRKVWERIDTLSVDEKKAIIRDLGVEVTVYEFDRASEGARWTLAMRVAPYDDYQWMADDWWRVDPEGYAAWAAKHGLTAELSSGDLQEEVPSTHKTCALLSATPRA